MDLSKLKALADKCDLKADICFGKSRKHCGKRGKCWLPAFSPFPTMFSKGYFLRVVKSRDCLVELKENPLKIHWHMKKSLIFGSFYFCNKKLIKTCVPSNGWLYWGLMPLYQLKSYHGGR